MNGEVNGEEYGRARSNLHVKYRNRAILEK